MGPPNDKTKSPSSALLLPELLSPPSLLSPKSPYLMSPQPVASPLSDYLPPPTYTLVLKEDSDVEEVASERKRQWQDTTLEVRAGQAQPLSLKPSPEGVVSLPPELKLNKETIVWVDAVRREKPHTVPIEWAMSPTNPAAFSKDPSTTHPASRSSPMPYVFSPSNSAQDLGVASRLRLSSIASAARIWGSTKLVDRKKFEKLAGLDDITLSQTLRLVRPPADARANASEKEKKKTKEEQDKVKDDVTWAPNFLPPASPDEKGAFLKDCIEFFHSHKVQVFVAFELVTQKPESVADPAIQKAFQQDADDANYFLKWLEEKNSAEDFKRHAQRLVQYVEQFGDFDGIFYDLEINGFNVEKHAQKIRWLYTAVASELALQDRYLAYATRAFLIDPETVPPPDPNKPDKQDRFLFEQPFTLALKSPNIIARPMSYDIGEDLRKQMTRFAIDPQQQNLHPSQFQVGLGTAVTTKPITHTAFGNECSKTYRTHRVGVYHWTLMGESDVREYGGHDKKLNPNQAPPGTIGQPLQGPLSEKRVKILEDAVGRAKSSG